MRNDLRPTTAKGGKTLGYVGLCYHYIRPPLERDPHPEILGNSEAAFREHLDMLSKHFEIITPDEAVRFSHAQTPPRFDRPGVLITFDDGLSDHHRAARILAEHGLRALFFLPTCVLADLEPANPTVIHYGLATHRISGFLDSYHRALDGLGIQCDRYRIAYDRARDAAWPTIRRIKATLKYTLSSSEARAVLLHIYRNLLLPENPDMLRAMHLSHDQVREMLNMGHSIGVHSHTHLSVSAARLSDEAFTREIISPQRYLESEFSTEVFALSYPFGGPRDCLTAEELQAVTDGYQLAFTVQEILNTRSTSAFELGRYMPLSTDDADDLREVVERIILSLIHI